MAYQSAILSAKNDAFSNPDILFAIFSYSSISENVDAVSASGKDASCTRAGLSDAAMECTCPSFHVLVSNTSESL